MKGEKSFTRLWSKSTTQLQPTHTLWIYDNGDTQGFLFENDAKWTVYKVTSRSLKEDGSIQESGTIQLGIPFQYFSIESYPACITQTQESLQIWIPGWKILETQRQLDQQLQHQQQKQQQKHQQKQQQQTQQQAQSQQQKSASGFPSQRSRHQQHQQPSPLRQPAQNLSASPDLEKSLVSPPKGLQPRPHNKRNTGPRPTSSPSSNQVSLSQLPTPSPTKPVQPHQRPASKKHPSQAKPVSMPGTPTLVSLNQTNSESHSPSQQVDR